MSETLKQETDSFKKGQILAISNDYYTATATQLVGIFENLTGITVSLSWISTTLGPAEVERRQRASSAKGEGLTSGMFEQSASAATQTAGSAMRVDELLNWVCTHQSVAAVETFMSELKNTGIDLADLLWAIYESNPSIENAPVQAITTTSATDWDCEDTFAAAKALSKLANSL